jgi:outer membrane murein-binding lipoprotein Lpp
MSLDLSKLKKKQLVSLISNKNEDILSLTEQVNQLNLDLEQSKEDVKKAKEQNTEITKITTTDEIEIKFYEERIHNCIHKDLVEKYRRELNRILDTYV